MRSFAPTTLYLVALALGASAAGCNFRYEKTKGDGLALVDPSSISYAMVRDRVLAPRCIGCHGTSGGINLESYSAVKPQIEAIQRVVVRDRTMPKGDALSEDELGLVSAWIQAGAPETPTPGNVEPSPLPLEATYSSIKRQIFDRRCMTCHRPEGSASDVPLAPYRDLLDSPRELVLPGNSEESGLYLAVSRTDEKRMPPPRVGAALSAEEVSTIQRWIDLGAPEGN